MSWATKAKRRWQGEGYAVSPRAWRRSSACTCGPAARSRGVAAALLAALEDAARTLGYTSARLDTGPKQVHALRLYRSAGYVGVPPYNDNPFACFWGEKGLA